MEESIDSGIDWSMITIILMVDQIIMAILDWIIGTGFKKYSITVRGCLSLFIRVLVCFTHPSIGGLEIDIHF